MNKLLTIVFLALLPAYVLAQSMSLSRIEKDLNTTYEKILTISENVDYKTYDSLEKVNLLFAEKMRLYTSKYPSTFTYNFNALRKNNFDIVDSPDRRLRIYSWDTWLGGTMVFFANVFQYSSGNKVFAKLAYDKERAGVPLPFYSEISILKTGNKTYYLAIANQIQDSRWINQSIHVYAIENGKLNNDVKLIKTKDGLVSSIDVSFDSNTVPDKPGRPLKLIKYNPADKTIYIAVVYEDGTVTTRFIIYKFTGRYFEHIKTEKK